MSRQRSDLALRVGVALLLVTGLSLLLCAAPRERVLGSFRTSLAARTRGQSANALRAARVLDGYTLPPGGELSFNRTVGPWSADRGYVLAPVSYEGELVQDWGGGVCQTSTTLYNAALLAGLEIVERARHSWAPRYVPAGLDAAVAVSSADLRLRNPYPWPVTFSAVFRPDSVGFEVVGRIRGPVAAVRVSQDQTVSPSRVVHRQTDLPPGYSGPTVRGRPGARVSVYRTFLQGPRRGQEELVSQDSYPPMTQLVLAGPVADMDPRP